jgi:hypothetical protein
LLLYSWIVLTLSESEIVKNYYAVMDEGEANLESGDRYEENGPFSISEIEISKIGIIR